MFTAPVDFMLLFKANQSESPGFFHFISPVGLKWDLFATGLFYLGDLRNGGFDTPTLSALGAPQVTAHRPELQVGDKVPLFTAEELSSCAMLRGFRRPFDVSLVIGLPFCLFSTTYFPFWFCGALAKHVNP